MIVNDLLKETDEQLVKMLEEIDHEPVAWTPVILAELSRRGIVRLAESSRRLEKLTVTLIILSVVLALLAAPPAIEILRRLAAR